MDRMDLSAPPPGYAKGLIPRDFNVQPYGGVRGVAAFSLPIIPQSEWVDRMKSLNGQNLSDLRNIRGPNGGPIPSRDQNGKGYCWAHSGVSAMLLKRAFMNEPYADLSAYAIACKIKNYRDEGGNGIDGVQYTAEHGVPTSEFWPQQSMKSSNDNPATWANAALHKDYTWQDIDPSQMRSMFITALLLQHPVVFDSDPWGHSIAAMEMTMIGGMSAFDSREMDVGERIQLARDFVESHKIAHETTGHGRYLTQDEAEVWAGDKCRIWNSWGDGWKKNGTGIMPDDTGMPAIPNNAVALIATSASAT